MADYDGDGRIDLVSGSTCCQHPFCFYLFRRQPDGTFGPRQTINLLYPPEEYNFDEFPMNGLRSRVAVADWNGDGIPDLIVGNNRGPIGVVDGPLAGKEELTVRRLWPKGQQPIHQTSNPSVVDWDGDGRFDLVVAGAVDGVTGVYWFRNVGTKREPKLGPPQLLLGDDGCGYPTGIAVADWNGDGTLDLLVSRLEQRHVEAGHYRYHRQQIWVYLREAR